MTSVVFGDLLTSVGWPVYTSIDICGVVVFFLRAEGFRFNWLRVFTLKGISVPEIPILFE